MTDSDKRTFRRRRAFCDTCDTYTAQACEVFAAPEGVRSAGSWWFCLAPGHRSQAGVEA